ncbi:DNA-directed RNA polymerase (apicoplast) [Babesia ovis]|uniref:DNA-directed RNA polymerase n=1 Tax=Babesia ovis TaxID=5869 RepID=A0A9W5TCU5_BABOV|nr:DNA-directed RNA polymerase [Babesia ovis]
MFNIKDSNSVYKTYINFIVYRLYSLFFDVVRHYSQKKFINRKAVVKDIKIYFNLMSMKSVDKINYNSYYTIPFSSSYYSIIVPLKFVFSNKCKNLSINYNILNIPKIDSTGSILINGFHRTPVLHLKSIIKNTLVITKDIEHNNYLVSIRGNNYLYVSVKNNKYVYISINDQTVLRCSQQLTLDIKNKSFIKINIYEFINYLNIFNSSNIKLDNHNFFSIYALNSFYFLKDEIIKIVSKFINIKYSKTYFIHSDSISNKNVNSICENIFGLIKYYFTHYSFVDSIQSIQENFCKLDDSYSVELFRESFLLNPSLHYTNQLNLLSYVHNKFKLNIFGYSNNNNNSSTFSVPKYLRQSQYFYLNFINILYTLDGEKCGILSTVATNTRSTNNRFKTSIINKLKFNNSIYVDILSKNFYKLVTNSFNYTKKSIKFKIQSVEIVENGEFKLIKLDKIKTNLDLNFSNIFNITELIIPFLFNNDMCRSLMGSKMHTQAIPILHCDKQYVYTKYNKITNLLTNKCIITESEGIVASVTSYKITLIDCFNRHVNYYLSPYNVNDYNSYSRYTPIVWEGEKVNIGTILAVPGGINDFEFTLGFNNDVNYSFYYGYEHEDAIVLNKQLAYKNILSSLDFYIEYISLIVEKKSYLEAILFYTKKKLKTIYKTLYRVFSKLKKQKQKSKYVFLRKKRKRLFKRKISARAELLYSEIHNIKKLLKHELILSPSFIKLGRTMVYAGFQLFLASVNNIYIGDKLCGRHGNKGTISKIIEFSDSPYTSTDSCPNIITSPIGAASRMNVGQFLEGYVGNIAHTDNIRIKSPINIANSDLYSHLYTKSISNNFNNKFTINKFDQHSVVVFRDFKTGYKLKNFTHKVILYFFKLVHTSKSKFRYRFTELPVILQEVHNDAKEQKFGEMEVWSLESHGAAYNLREFSLIKTDIKFICFPNIDSDLVSKTFSNLIKELNSILISVKFMHCTT